MERREDTRIKITPDSFITQRHSKEKIGRIIDISRGGLSFYYLNTAPILSNCYIECGIWLQQQNLFFPHVIANTISDAYVVYKNPMKEIQLRRRGIQFCNLSFDQTEQLYFAYGTFLACNSNIQQAIPFHSLPLSYV